MKLKFLKRIEGQDIPDEYKSVSHFVVEHPESGYVSEGNQVLKEEYKKLVMEQIRNRFSLEEGCEVSKYSSDSTCEYIYDMYFKRPHPARLLINIVAQTKKDDLEVKGETRQITIVRKRNLIFPDEKESIIVPVRIGSISYVDIFGKVNFEKLEEVDSSLYVKIFSELGYNCKIKTNEERLLEKMRKLESKLESLNSKVEGLEECEDYSYLDCYFP